MIRATKYRRVMYVARPCPPFALVLTIQPQHGWFTPEAFELIKATTRAKFTHVWEKNEPAPDSLCEDLLLEYEKGKQKTAKKQRAKATREGTAEGDVDMDEDDEDE